ncbi:MAG: hypothetical protein NTV59_07025 [Chloroflexi bacterium]|nr:hypothetical protein [Chloroflexota bacterium]
MDKEDMFGLAVKIVEMLNPHYNSLEEVEKILNLVTDILKIKQHLYSEAAQGY